LRIQCERCATTYELDESRLPPSGAPVQCTRCQHVFRAFPPGAGGRTWIGQPPAPAPAEPAAAAPPPKPSPPVAAAKSPAPEPKRPVRAPGPPRAPPPADAGWADPRNNTTASRFAAKLRSGRRRGWLVAGSVVVGAAVALAVVLWARGRVAPEAVALRGEGDRLLLRDDRSSLERAAEKYAEATAVAPSYEAARAEEALALLLLSDDAADEARPAEERFRALESERSRESAEKAPGWGAREAALVARMRVAQADSQPSRDRSRDLKGRAVALLRTATREQPGLEAARALSLYYALDGEVERALQAAGRVEGDPWKTLAVATAHLRRGDPARLEESVAALEAVAVAHPEILRARLVLARVLAASGKRDEAVAVLDGILGVNAAHERAKVAKAEVLGLPAATVSPVPLRGKAPAREPGNLPRLRSKP